MRDIPGYEGRYAATSCGKIWSYKSKKFLTSSGEKDNYQIVCISDNNKTVTPYVHRLVAMAWLPNPDGYAEVNHINHKKDDNRVSNLEWCTKNYNLSHRRPWHKDPVKCIETGVVYRCIQEAAKACGIKPSNLSAHLHHNVPKSVNKLHFEIVD